MKNSNFFLINIYYCGQNKKLHVLSVVYTINYTKYFLHATEFMAKWSIFFNRVAKFFKSLDFFKVSVPFFIKKKTKKTVYAPGHVVKVKLWTQLCTRMSKYVWISMWNFFWNFLKFFQKLPSAHIFRNCTNLSKFVKFVKIIFHT